MLDIKYKLESKKGKNFVLMMVAIALFALFLRAAIKEAVTWGIAQNESSAQATLKLISTALENFAHAHLNSYPTEISSLAKTSPPYLDKAYLTPFTARGYNFSCSRLETGGYSCSAVPTKCEFSGRIIYTISTGGVLVTEKCEKRD